ncbi:MAG: hypothetical protein MUD08_12200 [Cytophagales bacterium]|nr:hypothetical protein [Cytophagales bacterium]
MIILLEKFRPDKAPKTILVDSVRPVKIKIAADTKLKVLVRCANPQIYIASVVKLLFHVTVIQSLYSCVKSPFFCEHRFVLKKRKRFKVARLRQVKTGQHDSQILSVRENVLKSGRRPETRKVVHGNTRVHRNSLPNINSQKRLREILVSPLVVVIVPNEVGHIEESEPTGRRKMLAHNHLEVQAFAACKHFNRNGWIWLGGFPVFGIVWFLGENVRRQQTK